MTVTVIIPNFNEEKTIIEILKRVNNQKTEDMDMEIIVIDDCSTDRSKELLKENPNLYTKLIELDKNLGDKFSLNNLDKLIQVILKSATYEFLYKPNLSIKIIIKEYLDASNFFIDDSQTKYLNALLENIAKKLRSSNA